ncbi:MAG: hypothetical protein JRH11_14860 [Deltaproteobacteria bacterium]|nr:hypothetical protein [Deltaproteobacteria bacterium]
MHLRVLSAAIVIFAVGCPRSAEPATATTTAPPSPEATPTAPVYDLHEWGLVSTGPNGFELAAGPGHQAVELVVDKPVLYVHAAEAMELRVTVTPGPGMSIAEHWPPMIADPLSWLVQVTPGPCTEPRQYPSNCRSADGYCETAELALYETSDAACLTHGDHRLPLLFYRMRADVAPPMPLEVRRSGDDVVVRNRSWSAGVGGVWRVRWNSQTGATNATRVDVPDVGGEATIPMPNSNGVAAARSAMRTDLTAHGLTNPEAGAFMRAWDGALFGAAGSVDQVDGDDGVAGAAVDSPVMPTDRRGIDDETSVDELTVDGIPNIFGGPRVADAILYWLPQDAIEGLAELEATPAPRHLRRAILVRADAR